MTLDSKRDLDLLTVDERADLERLLRVMLGRATTDAGDPLPVTVDEFEQVYVDGRIAGLCHEGALELVRDALVMRGAGATPG